MAIVSLAADLLAFYQKDLRDHPEGQELLGRLQITDPAVVEHFELGYCSDRALQAMSDAQYDELQHLGLAKDGRQLFHDCIVLPVKDADGQLVDLLGLRLEDGGPRCVHWQNPPKGLIGAACLTACRSVILTDDVHQALHVRQHGHANVLALRPAEEVTTHIQALAAAGVQRAYLLSRKGGQEALAKPLESAGLEVEPIEFSADA